MKNLVKVSAISPEVSVGDVDFNVSQIKQHIDDSDADILLFPELSITGYSCADLFLQNILIENAEAAMFNLAKEVSTHKVVIVGLPIRYEDELYNCAAVLHSRKVVGIVPKRFLPGYDEFYEPRWFKPGNMTCKRYKYNIPFGIDLLFKNESSSAARNFVLGVSLCEDDWVPIPPSAEMALNGANILCNLSASPERVGKHEYRLNQLVVGQSARYIAACAYASAGPSESTTDVVFGGHSAIAENGELLAESSRVGGNNQELGNVISSDIDIEKLTSSRSAMNTYGECAKNFKNKYYKVSVKLPDLGNDRKTTRRFDATPFIPDNENERNQRCQEIFGIQCKGLEKRLKQLRKPRFFLGVSGGLDSTLAELVGIKTLDNIGASRKNLNGITLPGWGTSSRTYENAIKLMELTGVSSEEISIKDQCVQTFKDIGHNPFGLDVDANDFEEKLLEQTGDDLVFQNTQARVRTHILMNKGFVLGTGDLSELALGWCTYNADHMSMYGVNCGVPKTLVKWVVSHVADTVEDDKLQAILRDIVATEISPELLPNSQSTEGTLGPYILHDFFLYHTIKSKFSPNKIIDMAMNSDLEEYGYELIRKTLITFYTRFFQSQYKRSCVPDGPKVGSVALSPRGDWRMPSDASVKMWLKELGA